MTEPSGATVTEWNHFSLILGLTPDLLPVVSNPNAEISPKSKMHTLGKTPSRYYSGRLVGGISRWTSHKATPGEVSAWAKEPDYGICVQTKTVRALDCDINDSQLAKDIHDEINNHLQALLPARRRDGAHKFLLAFSMPGEFAKRTIQTDHGAIEFLATGQQFVACGTHPSGARYEWVGGLPEEIPELQPDVFERLWRRLVECFGVDGMGESSASVGRMGASRVRQLTEATLNDPTAKSLHDKGLVVSTERDGRLHIVCPFESEHTVDSAESATTYFPAFTGGFERGHFHCLHAHCAERSDAEFRAALGVEEALDDFDIVAETATDVLKPTTGNRYAFETIEQFSTRAPPGWIIKSVLPRAALTVIFGESGSGKTFLALDLGMSVARGVEWRSHHATQGRVAYIAAEDATGVQARIKAYLTHHEVVTPPPFYVLAESPNFMDGADVKEVLKALTTLGPVSLVIVDTWAQVTPGANENSGEDMGKAMKYCRVLHRATGANVVLIHHSGKDATKGARGWSGLRAAADCEVEVTRCEHDRVATVTKLKNAQDGADFGFKLHTVTVGVDDDGDDITSCVLEHTQAKPKNERSRREPKGVVEKLVARVLNDLSIGGAVVTADLITAVVDHMPFDAGEGKRDKRREHALRALNGLVERGAVTVEGNGVSLRGVVL